MFPAGLGGVRKDASVSQSGEWEKVTDSTTGDSYYWNRRTNETSWTKPKAAIRKMARRHSNPHALSVVAVAEDVAGAKSSRRARMSQRRSAGFERVYTDDGEVYYWNPKTGETSWEDPSGQIEKRRSAGKSQAGASATPAYSKVPADGGSFHARIASGVSELFQGATAAATGHHQRWGSWVQLTDDATGNPYYFHPRTNETSWDPPKVVRTRHRRMSSKF